jgi:hypothetical protein
LRLRERRAAKETQAAHRAPEGQSGTTPAPVVTSRSAYGEDRQSWLPRMMP